MRCNGPLQFITLFVINLIFQPKPPNAGSRFVRGTREEAIALARDNNLPIIVFSLDEPGGFRGVLAGEGTYTTVHG